MSRIPFLDGLRGVLAVIVVAHHVIQHRGSDALVETGALAVTAFWLISAYVLCRSYQPDFTVFVARRWMRLCPVFVLCVWAGALVHGEAPSLDALLMLDYADVLRLDPPAWSLIVEWIATPALPLLFWAVRRGWGPWVALGCGVATVIDHRLIASVCFATGAWASTFDIRWPMAPRWVVWLGTISYSLYLAHFPLLDLLYMRFGRDGMWAMPILALPVAWLVWRLVEVPSIAWSRRVGWLRGAHAPLRQG